MHLSITGRLQNKTNTYMHECCPFILFDVASIFRFGQLNIFRKSLDTLLDTFKKV